METILRTSFTTTPVTPEFEKLISSGGFAMNRSSCLVFANGYSSLLPFSSQKSSLRLRRSVVVEAKNDKKKIDTHSFVVKPDEATGPFPEAVLLREKKLQEDGSLLPEFADSEEEKIFEYLNLKLESHSNVKQMRHYEVVYLIHENHKEEVGSVNSKVEDFLREKKGKVWRFSDWGLRRLAYKIQKAKNAHYILMNFELEAKWINDFKSMLDKDERVIRHLVIKRDEAITEDCPPPLEFHTMRGNMDDDEDGIEDGDAYEDEDGDDLDDEGEIDMASYDDDTEDSIIYVEDDADEVDADGDIKKRNNRKPNVSSTGRRVKAEKVGSGR
ncbi:protein REGULATOR OF FATTY ACID COMPOSITION 3, chloroplastic [Cornus florida]|uniref:protein REGULATOR OF FATTY ACID COMPOSITION 3, chloroplastic n=1 Tax=Cornus florida TaxID=4283 RepID=UPI0028A25AF6|nr:protein REGULATOR OF FATTY ACID COMPOSITION 3, chloroplastic [Cornus florida]